MQCTYSTSDKLTHNFALTGVYLISIAFCTLQTLLFQYFFALVTKTNLPFTAAVASVALLQFTANKLGKIARPSTASRSKH